MRLFLTVRFALAVLTFAPALLAANSALAQAGALSDLFNESLTDAAGNNIPLPAVRPLVNVPIPESPTAEGPFTITVPAMNIGFTESTATGSGPSDYLHINSYQVIVRSDDEVGLPFRTAVPARVIPASANETFLPVSIFAGSDGDQVTGAAGSDHVTVYVGFFGQANPTPVFDATLPEPTDPLAPERVDFNTAGALFFDLVEPPGEGGSLPVSDYVDFPNGVTGFFISSDNPADFSGLPAPDATVIEDPINGMTVHYSTGFVSDVVPEPGSLVLLGLGLVAIGFSGRRQIVQSAVR